MPHVKGRLLCRSIAESERFASLSQRAALLFVLIIPHLDSFGKMQANPYTIKGMVCPKISYFSVEEIGQCLGEITRKTNLKYFFVNGTWYLHALEFEQHQKLQKHRRGKDHLPSFTPGGTPG
jgi:hypothetical protein